MAPTLAPFRGETLSGLLALGSFWLLAELDIVLARHYLGADASGYYSSAALLARALLFLPGALALVALPRFAAARRRPELALRRLRTTLWLVAALCACGFLGLVALRHLLVTTAFGSSFAPAARLLPLLALGGAALAVVSVLVYYHIALETKAYRFVLGGVAVEAVLVAFFHGSGGEIGLVFVFSTALVAALQLHAAYAASRWSRSAEHFELPDAPLLPGDPPELSIVLPSFNAAAELPGVVSGIRRCLAGTSYEIVVVSDGSTDATERVAAGLGQDVKVVHYPLRVGKGHALRVGLARSSGRYVAFLDADGDIDPAALGPFVELMRLFEPDIVLGSKRHPLSELHYPALRRLLSWGYQKLVRLLFRVNVRDTQTGLKLIRREVLNAVLPRMLEKRYAFDLELLVVARLLGFRRVFEAPVRLDYRFSSRVDPHATLRIFLDTLAIFYRRYLLATYGSPRSVPGRKRQPSGDRLQILFLNWRDVRNPDAGGAEVWTHEVARRWVEQGHSVSLLTSRFAGCRRNEVIDGVRVRRVGRLRAGTFHLLAQLRLARLRGFDVVIDEINTIPFFTPLWRWRLPTTVALIHQLAADVWDAELPRPLAALGRRLEPRLLRLYRDTPVIAVSDSTRNDLLALGLENVHVVHGGRDEPPSLDGVEKEPVPTFLFVGRLAANKRPDDAVEAFRHIRRELRDARLWIIGQGPLEARLRASLPDGAELLGHVSRDHLYERMARAHCLLVPSVREGWGLVVIEAASVGTPSAGYEVPGVRDSIRDGVTGVLVASGDPAALSGSAVEMVSAPDYELLREVASSWARQFSWTRTAGEFRAAIDDAAARLLAPASSGRAVESRVRTPEYPAPVSPLG